MIRKKFQNGGQDEDYFTYDPESLAGVTTDVTRFAPFIEGAARAFIPDLEKATARALTQQDLADLYRGVVPQTDFQQNIIQRQLSQAGLGQAAFDPKLGTLTDITTAGTGIAAFEPFVDEAQRLSGVDPTTGQVTAAGVQAARDPFLSPFQEQVIATTRASFENQRARQRLQIAEQARQAQAFGGARQGVQEGVFDAETALGIAALEADLRERGLAAADAARVAESGVQAQRATEVPGLRTQQLAGLQQLGAGQQALQQQQRAILEAQSRERIFDPQQRLGAFAQSFAPLVQGIGPQSVFRTDVQPPPNPLDTIVGVGTVGAGLLGGLGSILGTG
mgnify:CR=1 FL=1|jgi:hypothetical protein